MLFIFPPHDLNQSAELIIRSFNNLKVSFAIMTVLLVPFKLSPSVILAADNLIQALLVVFINILVHNPSVSLLVSTHDLPELSLVSVLGHISPSVFKLTAIIKHRVAFVRTVNNLKRTRVI